jgi:hypothetical protein
MSETSSVRWLRGIHRVGERVVMIWDLYYAARAFSLAIFVLIVLVLVWLLATEWYNASLRQFTVDHFPATVGIPVAAVFAFVVVALFESTAGNVKFEAAFLKFDGAAGPIIMWILCFLSIIWAIKLLW